jgi:hypothetical protein
MLKEHSLLGMDLEIKSGHPLISNIYPRAPANSNYELSSTKPNGVCNGILPLKHSAKEALKNRRTS